MTTYFVYVCPECKFTCSVPGMHQHANGEWIDNLLVKMYVKMKQWDALDKKLADELPKNCSLATEEVT